MKYHECQQSWSRLLNICSHANLIIKLRIEWVPISKNAPRTFLWSWIILFTRNNFHQKILCFGGDRSLLVTQLTNLKMSYLHLRFYYRKPYSKCHKCGDTQFSRSWITIGFPIENRILAEISPSWVTRNDLTRSNL